MSREPATRPAESPSSPATLLVSMIVIYLQLILEAGYRFGSRPHQHPHSPYCPIITRPGGVAQGYLRFRPPFRRLAGQTNQSLNRLGAARGAERPSFPAAPTLPKPKLDGSGFLRSQGRTGMMLRRTHSSWLECRYPRWVQKNSAQQPRNLPLGIVHFPQQTGNIKSELNKFTYYKVRWEAYSAG